MGFDFQELELSGAYLIENFFAGDRRGGFLKCFEKDIYLSNGISFNLNETFLSVSSKNVVRGLHFQIHNPQAKLVCVPRGKVYDVLVDLRVNSKTFKQWMGFELSEENHCALYIPKGFAHGFVALEDETIMLYQCEGAYDKETDTGIVYNDPEIAIKWPVEEENQIHSDRDLGLVTLEEYLKTPMEI